MFYINNSLQTDKRYDTAKFLEFTDDLDPLNSYMLININRLPEQGTIILNNQELRPDLLSYKIYGDTQYWWILLKYNNIIDLNDLYKGRVISYPSLNDIEYLYERASILRKTI